MKKIVKANKQRICEVLTLEEENWMKTIKQHGEMFIIH